MENMIDCVEESYYYDAYFALDGNPLFFPVDDHPNPVSSERYYAVVPEPYAMWEDDPSDAEHNFHFTSEIRFWFYYESTRIYTLDLLGDDDIWGFINGALAVDIGGIHTPVEGNVTLDSETASDFDIAANGVYEIAIFHAERQTSSSTFKLMLTGFELPRSVCTPS